MTAEAFEGSFEKESNVFKFGPEAIGKLLSPL